MRVRYKMFSDTVFRSECDLTELNAKKLYNELETNPMCLWCELVSEDDSEGANYMEVINSFEHNYKEAELFKSLGAKG